MWELTRSERKALKGLAAEVRSSVKCAFYLELKCIKSQFFCFYLEVFEPWTNVWNVCVVLCLKNEQLTIIWIKVSFVPHRHQFFGKRPKNYPHSVDIEPLLIWAKNKKRHLTTLKDMQQSKTVHAEILTTAGDGTWMLPTERGRTWFAKWHSTTPSVNADATSFGSVIFKRLSIAFRSCSINSVSSFCRSNSRRIVKLSFSAGISRFQDTFLQILQQKYRKFRKNLQFS